MNIQVCYIKSKTPSILILRKEDSKSIWKTINISELRNYCQQYSDNIFIANSSDLKEANIKIIYHLEDDRCLNSESEIYEEIERIYVVYTKELFAYKKIFVNEMLKKELNSKVFRFVEFLQTTEARRKMEEEMKAFLFKPIESLERQKLIEKLIQKKEYIRKIQQILNEMPDFSKLEKDYKHLYDEFTRKFNLQDSLMSEKSFFRYKNNSSCLDMSDISKENANNMNNSRERLIFKDNSFEQTSNDIFTLNNSSKEISKSILTNSNIIKSKDSIKNVETEIYGNTYDRSSIRDRKRFKERSSNKGFDIITNSKKNLHDKNKNVKMSLLLRNISISIVGMNRLNDILGKINIPPIQIPEKLEEQIFSIINPAFDPTLNPLFSSNIIELIRPGLDECLDISRKMYFENIQRLHRKLSLYFPKGLESYRDPCVGICLKKNKRAVNDVIPNIKSYENLKVIRETKTFNLFTNIDIRVLNYKINEAFNIVMRASAGIIAKMFSKTELHISIFSNTRNILQKLDVGCAMASFALLKMDQFSFPNFSNRICLKNLQCLNINKSKAFNYSLDMNIKLELVTGINNSGKTTYVKNLIFNIFLAYLGCPVPASCSEIILFNNIFYIESFHQYQNVLRFINNQTLIAIDEINIPISIQKNIINTLYNKRATILFITHKNSMINHISDNKAIQFTKLADYSATKGISRKSNAINLARVYLPPYFVKVIDFYYSKLSGLEILFENHKSIKEVKSSSDKNEKTDCLYKY